MSGSMTSKPPSGAILDATGTSGTTVPWTADAKLPLDDAAHSAAAPNVSDEAADRSSSLPLDHILTFPVPGIVEKTNLKRRVSAHSAPLSKSTVAPFTTPSSPAWKPTVWSPIQAAAPIVSSPNSKIRPLCDPALSRILTTVVNVIGVVRTGNDAALMSATGKAAALRMRCVWWRSGCPDKLKRRLFRA